MWIGYARFYDMVEIIRLERKDKRKTNGHAPR